MRKKTRQWVHVRLDLFAALKRFAAARGEALNVAADQVIGAGIRRKTQDVRRNEARQAVRS